MMLLIAFALVLGLIFMPSIQNQSAQAIPTNGKIIPGEFIVTLKPTSDRHVIALAEQFNETLQQQGGSVDKVYTKAIDGFSVKGVDNIEPLAFDPAVQKVERNMARPVDAQYASTAVDRIDLDKAATAAYRPDRKETKTNVDIAVIDSVVHPHADLNIFRTVSMISGVDPVIQDHGTHVAGICCAKDNLGGVVGTAQGARIWSLRICGGDVGDGLCSTSGIIAAANYVIQNKASIEVATMSCCGGNPESSAETTAINSVLSNGVTFTRSAGNTGTQCESDWGCAHSTAIVVSNLQDFDGKCGGLQNLGTNRDDILRPSSTWGSQIDIMAPGTNILSTWPVSVGDAFPSQSQFPYIGMSQQGFYQFLTGTSMSTPVVAGVAALVKLSNPSWTPAQIKTDLQAKAYGQTQSCDGSSKGGLVQGANTRGSEKILWAGAY